MRMKGVAQLAVKQIYDRMPQSAAWAPGNAHEF